MRVLVFLPLIAVALVQAEHESTSDVVVPEGLAPATSQIQMHGPDCACEKGVAPNTAKAPEVAITVNADGEANYAEAYKSMPDWAERKKKVKAVLSSLKDPNSPLAQVYTHVCANKDYLMQHMDVQGVMKPSAEIPKIAAEVGVDVCDVLFWSITYEVAGGCTSMVMNGADGSIVHGRNLDYSAFPVPHDCKSPECQGDIGAMTIHAKITTPQTAFEGPAYIAYVGTLTGMAKGRLSVSLNERYPAGSFDMEAIKKNFAVAFPPDGSGQYDPSKVAPGLWIRKTLSDPHATYATAKNALQSQAFVVPAYLTLGGVTTGEGSITAVTRDPHPKWQSSIGQSQYPCTANYCLVTNYDAPDDVGPHGAHEVNRYQCGVQNAQNLINAHQTDVKPTDVLSNVMKQCMTFVTWSSAAFATTYSTAMKAKTGEIQVEYQPYTGPPKK